MSSASLLLKLHYSDLLEEELAERAREKNKVPKALQIPKKSNRARLSENMCTNSQMEKVVEYMEMNGDLSKLTHRGGGNQVGRCLAEAGWKELTNIVNNSNAGTEKTPTQLRRSWGDFKCKIKKKQVKLQGYKDLPAGKAPYLSDLELRVLALENSADLLANNQDSASTVYGSEPEASQSAVWQPTENSARHNLELPIPTRDIQIKKEIDPFSVKPSPEKEKVKITLVKVPPTNSKDKNPSPKDFFMMTADKKASPEAPNGVVSSAPVINNGTINRKHQDEREIADGVSNISIINLDSPDSPDIDHIEIERQFAHLSQLYEKTHGIANKEKKINTSFGNANKSTEKYPKNIHVNGTKSKNFTHALAQEQTNSNGKKIGTCIEATNKSLENIHDNRVESKITKKTATKHGTKRNLTSNRNNENENQNQGNIQERGYSSKKVKVTNIEDVVSLFLENMKEQRELELKREQKRMELEERRLENERESLRQRDVQLAQNAQILNVVVQLAELTERVLNKRNA